MSGHTSKPEKFNPYEYYLAKKAQRASTEQEAVPTPDCRPYFTVLPDGTQVFGSCSWHTGHGQCVVPEGNNFRICSSPSNEAIPSADSQIAIPSANSANMFNSGGQTIVGTFGNQAGNNVGVSSISSEAAQFQSDIPVFFIALALLGGAVLKVFHRRMTN